MARPRAPYPLAKDLAALEKAAAKVGLRVAAIVTSETETRVEYAPAAAKIDTQSPAPSRSPGGAEDAALDEWLANQDETAAGAPHAKAQN